MRSQVVLKYHTALITNACGFGENFQDTTVLERIWQEGVSSFSYFVTVYSERQTVTMLCFALECTRLIRCYVDTCRWAWCTFARLLIHEERMVILFYTVFQTWTHYWGIKVDFTVLWAWMHIDLQSWLPCASVMNAHGVVSVCFSGSSTMFLPHHG